MLFVKIHHRLTGTCSILVLSGKNKYRDQNHKKQCHNSQKQLSLPRHLLFGKIFHLFGLFLPIGFLSGYHFTHKRFRLLGNCHIRHSIRFFYRIFYCLRLGLNRFFDLFFNRFRSLLKNCFLIRQVRTAIRTKLRTFGTLFATLTANHNFLLLVIQNNTRIFVFFGLSPRFYSTLFYHMCQEIIILCYPIIS